MTLLAQFLAGAPQGTAETLEALACAESLTDSVALDIYERVPVPGLSAKVFVSAFKYSGLTEPRNSEWNLVPRLRQELAGSRELSPETKTLVHQFLLSLGTNEKNRPEAGRGVPSYLFTQAGLAYHLAGAGRINEALHHYGEASKGRLTGAQWLAAKLAEEQERFGVIPESAIETTFLRAMVLLREGRRRDAMPLFGRVAATDLVRREVAISLHILGNDNNRGDRRDAERELRRSIEINVELGDQSGVAQALHSLGNLLTRQGRFDQAEEAYLGSIEIDNELGNQFGVAQALHSFANLLTRQDRFDEAEKAYRRSVKIDGELGNQFGVAQTLHSFANLLARQGRFDDAEEAYRRSITIGEDLGTAHGVAKRLHSLANLLTRLNRLKDAEEAYGRSIAMLENLDDQYGVAQTLHSLGNLLIREDRVSEAEDAFRRSISIGEKLRNESHLAQVFRSYALAIQSRSPDRALALLERSRDINRKNGNTRFVRLLEREIRNLEARNKGQPDKNI